MRKKNWRVIIVGIGLLAVAGIFFVVMPAMVPQPIDRVALMTTVGQVSGVVGGFSVAMVIVGLIGKKAPPG